MYYTPSPPPLFALHFTPKPNLAYEFVSNDTPYEHTQSKDNVFNRRLYNSYDFHIQFTYIFY